MSRQQLARRPPELLFTLLGKGMQNKVTIQSRLTVRTLYVYHLLWYMKHHCHVKLTHVKFYHSMLTIRKCICLTAASADNNSELQVIDLLITCV